MAGCPIDPIDFIRKENWVNVTTIGSIFTFSMVNKFRDTVFDPVLVYLLPPESFEFMKIELPDIPPSPNVKMVDPDNPTEMIENNNSYTINFGSFIRETIIWIFMILILYILAIYIRFPGTKGGSTGAAIM